MKYEGNVLKEGGVAKGSRVDQLRPNWTSRTGGSQSVAETSGEHAGHTGLRELFDMTCVIPSTIHCAIHTRTTARMKIRGKERRRGAERHAGMNASNNSVGTPDTRGRDTRKGGTLKNCSIHYCAIQAWIHTAHINADIEMHARPYIGRTLRGSWNAWTHVKTCTLICCISIAWFMRLRRREVHASNNAARNEQRETRKTMQYKRLREQRRWTQSIIRNWQLARKLTYDGKNRRKYRNKVRASKRWFRHKHMKEAEEANIRERQRRPGKTQEKGVIRKGGAGENSPARPVYASSTEEGVMRIIGVPQHTWGDGSCWLWAVAGALGMLEGKEGPTDKDIKLEREWREAIRDTVRERGIPMTTDELNGLSEG
eukprot:3904803-Pleurochrysis_carterae.AAC.1